MTIGGGDPDAEAASAFLRAASELLARRGGEIESRVSGRSMGRTLPPGTEVRIRWAPGSACRDGDLIAFVAGRQLVTHRVVGRGHSAARRQFLITRGDGTWLCDPPVAEELVVGVVREWRDGARWRPAAEIPAADPGVAAALFQRALVLALDVGLGAARALHKGAHVADSLAVRVRSRTRPPSA